MRLCFLLVALTSALSAAPLRQDVGQGLIYFRVHQLPADLPGKSVAPLARSTILDGRYVTGDTAAAAALTAWLKANASLKQPVILLANTGTSSALLASFAEADAIPGLVVIGPARSRVATDIAVDLANRRERKAYDALESGVPLSTLIDENPDKPRNDEARLAKDHISDAELAASSEPAPLHDAPPSPAPLIDAELQRAVQFYSALLALKRL